MELSNTDWLTLLLVLITGFYAWAKFEILKANKAVVNEMKEQTSAHLRPYIVVSATPRAGATVIDLDIINTGRSPAKGLKLKMNKDFYFNGHESDSDNIF